MALTFKALVFDFALDSTPGTPLGRLLDRLFQMFKEVSDLHLKQQGAILMFDPTGRPVQVAQYGMPAAWSCTFDWSVLNPPDQPKRCEIRTVAGRRLPQATSSTDAIEESFLALPLIEGDNRLGYLALFPDGTTPLRPDYISVLADLARVMSGLVARTLLDEMVQVREWELEESRTEAIHRLGSAAEYRDNDTGWHVMRMTNYALAIARQMGLPEEQRDKLFITAPMHDVGKIGIPDSILLKPGKLTEEERRIMNRHTEIGERILKGKDALTETAREIAGSHHERWDGLGYPRQLRGEEIPLLARICAVADVFDALTTTRPYKKPWPFDDAVEFISSQAGTQFDSVVVAAFREALTEIQRIRQLYRDDIIDPAEVLTLPPARGKEGGWVSWDDSLRVGIDVIDEHHRHLLELINDIYNVIVEQRGARELAKMLKALDLYSQVHFRAEERMMEHYGFRGLEAQKRQHRIFERRLHEFHEELHTNPLVAQYDVLEFAREWLIFHILEEDTQLISLVKTKAA